MQQRNGGKGTHTMRTRSCAPTWLARNTDQTKPGRGVDMVEDKNRENRLPQQAQVPHTRPPKLKMKARMRTHVPPNML